MSLDPFTLFHTAISLVALLAGYVAVIGLVRGKLLVGWTGTFLWPAHGVGIVSLIGLAVALYALYMRKLQGAWRHVYVVSAVFSLYLNMFVAVVQAFQKIPALKAAAPTQSEPPFIAGQVVIMFLFIALGWRACVHFRGYQTVPAELNP